MSDLDYDALPATEARYQEYLWLWGWHPEGALDLDGAAVSAGYGAHMAQMLYRLPRDGQTDDMRRSIQSMLGDLSRLLHLAQRAEADRAAVERVRMLIPDWDTRAYFEPGKAWGEASRDLRTMLASPSELRAALDPEEDQ